MDIIVKSLAGKPFTYEGKFFKLPETSLFPSVTQKPHPPIWIVAQSQYAVEATVRRGFNVLTGGFGVSVERLAEFGEIFRKAVETVKPSTTPHVGVQRA